jgi:HPt (histidine-containing phosphotransfer) domain-containing protein
MTNGRQIFDRATFDRQLGGDRALGLQILQMFIEDCPERVAAIKRAVERGDANGLQTAAHTLKGSAGYLAAAFVVEAAVELERIGREGRLSEAPSALGKLEGAVAQLMPEIERATLA